MGLWVELRVNLKQLRQIIENNYGRTNLKKAEGAQNDVFKGS